MPPELLCDGVCEGWVYHRRAAPAHHFRYRVWMLWLDVARLGRGPLRLLRRRLGLSPLAIAPQDYLDGARDLLGSVHARLARHGYPAPQHVFLLTQPRSWVSGFNPVSFYFCVGEAGLEFILADINNTPWDERHTYVLDARDQSGEFTFSFPKAFHVSPFMPMDLEYRWRFAIDREEVKISMGLFRDGEETFNAGLRLTVVPLTRGRLLRGMVRYPLQNVVTLARIYWQATRLYAKRSRFYPHPDRAEEAPAS
jgi:DUF1365 family protein